MKKTANLISWVWKSKKQWQMLIVTNLTCPARSEQNEKARLYGVKMANLIDKTKASGKFHSWSSTKRKRKHLNIWRRKTRATYTIALTQNITIYQNGLPWVVKKRAISWRKKWWSIKFLPYQPLKYIVKLSIKLNFYLYLFEWITCQYQSLSRLILLNNTLYKKIILKDSLFEANGYNSY